MKKQGITPEPIPLKGGVDSVTTPMLVKPGTLLSAINFEPDIYGGYRRIAGIERYDGRSRPSDASYWLMSATVTGSVEVGDVVTGATSGETGTVIAIVEGDAEETTYGFFGLLEIMGVFLSGKGSAAGTPYTLVLTKVTGDFTASETINVSGSPEALFIDIEENAAATGELHATYKNLAADEYRNDIGKPAGSGPIRGVCHYKGDEYCFRDNAGATACIMFKATASGWSSISFGREIQFTGAVGEISEGDTVTGATSGASAVVKRALLRTGTWSSAGVGTLVFDSITSGPFQTGENLQVSAVTKAVADGADSAISLQPGGRFVFDNINFSGTTDTRRMYFADGVNYIGEFDGTRLVPIRTGIGNDAPKYIVGHKNHLFMAVESSVQASGVGDPYSWTALTGAAELGLGEDCTGLLPQVGDATTGVLVVTTDTRIFLLYGNDSSDFNLVLHSPESGAKAYTHQNIGFAHFMDALGVTNLQTSQAFGGFEMGVMTRAMQPFIDSKQGLQTASCIVKKKNQYRLFFNDGQGLIVYSNRGRNGLEVSLMPFDYGADFYMNQVCSFTDTDGTERIMAAGSDGYVYELDRGTSIDGEVISAHFMTVFNHSKSIRLKKRYRRTVFQFRATNTAHVNIGYDLSYGNLDPSYGDSVSMSQTIAKTVNSAGGLWDNFNWDEFTWDASYMQEINVDTPGNGESIAIIVSGETDVDEPYTIHTCILHYFHGRQSR